MNTDRCRTCRHWREVAPATSDDGECHAVGVSVYKKSNHVVLAGNIVRYPDGPDRPGDATRLITDASFGCVRWDSRWSLQSDT